MILSSDSNMTLITGGRKIFFQYGCKYNKNFSVGINVIKKERKQKGKKELHPRLELVTSNNIFLYVST